LKAKVIQAFVDKNTGEPYNEGYTFESDKADRITELQEGGYLEVLAPKETPKKANKGKATD
jgi:hypothetical protein